MKTIWLGLSVIGLVAAVPAPAKADCQCVAAGKRYQLGEVACLSLPEGDRLARCSLVLNNSSWTKLQDSCLVGSNATPPVSATHGVTSVAAADQNDHPVPAKRIVDHDH